MNIKFQGHQQTEREVEISQKELFQLFQMMKDEFLNHITFARFDDYSYYNQTDKGIVDLCNRYSVDPSYDRDRVAFFKSIMESMRNPYQ